VRSEVQILPGPLQEPGIRARAGTGCGPEPCRGGVAQPGERLLCTQEGAGSNPVTSTILAPFWPRIQRSPLFGPHRPAPPRGRARENMICLLFDDCEERRDVRRGRRCSRREVSSRERLPPCGAAPAAPALQGVPAGGLPLGAAVWLSARQGHLVDALALRGDEGRSTLRKARGRGAHSLIPGSPNGATHPHKGYHPLNP
jgi:hypothetical protein